MQPMGTVAAVFNRHANPVYLGLRWGLADDIRRHAPSPPPRSLLSIRIKKVPGSSLKEPGLYLATTYSHRTCRPTTIGAAAFHFRVRNGTGWFHRALVTRVQHYRAVLTSGDLSWAKFAGVQFSVSRNFFL